MKNHEPNIIAHTAIEGQCIVWTGALTSNGYGRIGHNATTARVHRLVWEMFNGQIPKGGHVCHKCDNRRCCFIGHLFLATQRVNILDMIQKGRGYFTGRRGRGGLSDKPWKSNDYNRQWALRNPEKYRAQLDRKNAKRRKHTKV